MKIIGHRGAAGLALENTVVSITAALAAGVDAVEVDVRQTSDGVFVLCHDANFKRLGGHGVRVQEQTATQVLSQKLRQDIQPATLLEALKVARQTTLVVEAKGDGWAKALANVLQPYLSKQKILVIALEHEELAKFHSLLPTVPTYVVQRFSSGDVLQAIRDAKRLGMTGVDMNFWLLNPLTYWLARRADLDVIVYTVDSPWIARFLLRLFPSITITTNRPDRMRGVIL